MQYTILLLVCYYYYHTIKNTPISIRSIKKERDLQILRSIFLYFFPFKKKNLLVFCNKLNIYVIIVF